jgi:hypothetical protein
MPEHDLREKTPERSRESQRRTTAVPARVAEAAANMSKESARVGNGSLSQRQRRIELKRVGIRLLILLPCVILRSM